MLQRRRLKIGILALRAEMSDDGVGILGVVKPSRQPRADISAARHRREVVELVQQFMIDQRLDHAERYRRAPDAAPGEAQRAQPLHVEQAVEGAPTRALFDVSFV